MFFVIQHFSIPFYLFGGFNSYKIYRQPMKFSCVTIFGSHVSNCFKTSSNKGVASAWSPAGVVSPAALVLRQKPVMTLSGRIGSVQTPWKWDWKSGKEPHRDPFENARMSVVKYISMRKNDVKSGWDSQLQVSRRFTVMDGQQADLHMVVWGESSSKANHSCSFWYLHFCGN